MTQNIDAEKSLSELANSIGDFIRYWGFRRVHGQIWTLLYLKNTTMSPTEIALSLNVSKSLISSALVELEQHGLIHPFNQADSINRKTKLFIAETNVMEVIKSVLKEREIKLIQNVNQKISTLKNENNNNIDIARLQNLELWTGLAQTSVQSIADLSELSEMPNFQ